MTVKQLLSLVSSNTMVADYKRVEVELLDGWYVGHTKVVYTLDAYCLAHGDEQVLGMWAEGKDVIGIYSDGE